MAINLFNAMSKIVRPRYVPKVKTDRWGNRGKYIPAGVNKNTKPENR